MAMCVPLTFARVSVPVFAAGQLAADLQGPVSLHAGVSEAEARSPGGSEWGTGLELPRADVAASRVPDGLPAPTSGTFIVQASAEVEQPITSSENAVSLVPGMFVEVFISGDTLSGVLPIPRHALREGRFVWVFREGRLRIVPVGKVLRTDRETAYLEGGLESGTRIVTTPLDAVTEGMLIRTGEPPAGAEGSPTGPKATSGGQP